MPDINGTFIRGKFFGQPGPFWIRIENLIWKAVKTPILHLCSTYDKKGNFDDLTFGNDIFLTY